MANEDTILIDFWNWMKENGLPKMRETTKDDNKRSRDNYVVNINTAYKRIQELLSSPNINPSVSEAQKELAFKPKDFVSLLTKFVRSGDMLYALTVFDRMYNLFCAVLENYDDKNMSDRHSAFVLLKEFLYRYDYTKIQKTYDDIDEIRHKLSQGEMHKLDGMESLLSILSNKDFVKLAVQNSYFFDPDLIDKQVQNYKKYLNKARLTTNKKINNQGGIKGESNVQYFIPQSLDTKIYTCDYPCTVTIDSDGNSFVRDLIFKRTGVTISFGNNCLFQNTIISHIWGKAYDPRFFVNLWNIVLIPSWANSLMDKNTAEGSLASMLKATYMKICHQLYQVFNNNDYWSSLGLKTPKIIHLNDAVKYEGKYIINVINETPSANSDTNKIVLISKMKL